LTSKPYPKGPAQGEQRATAPALPEGQQEHPVPRPPWTAVLGVLPVATSAAAWPLTSRGRATCQQASAQTQESADVDARHEKTRTGRAVPACAWLEQANLVNRSDYAHSKRAYRVPNPKLVSPSRDEDQVFAWEGVWVAACQRCHSGFQCRADH
jgi:hypothetical protein